MTIQELLDQVDENMPNMIMREQKVKWLANLDGMVWRDTILTHEENPGDWTDVQEEGAPATIEPGVRHDFFDPLGDMWERKWPGCQHQRTKTFVPYDNNTPMDTELLVRDPYTDVYLWYLFSRINLRNKELDEYNNSMTMFNNAMLTFQDYWNRTHRAIYAATEFKL